MHDSPKPTRVSLSVSNWIAIMGMFIAAFTAVAGYTSHVAQQIGQNTHDNERQEDAIQRNTELVNDTARTLARIQGKLDRAEQQ